MKRQSKRGVSLGHTLVKCNVNRHLKKKKCVCIYMCLDIHKACTALIQSWLGIWALFSISVLTCNASY